MIDTIEVGKKYVWTDPSACQFNNKGCDYIMFNQSEEHSSVPTFSVYKDGQQIGSCFHDASNMKRVLSLHPEHVALTAGIRVGDRVQCKQGEVGDAFPGAATVRYLTHPMHPKGLIQVERDDGKSGGGNEYNGKALWLVHINKLVKIGGSMGAKTLAVELTDGQKAGLSKEDQALIELGVITNTLELSDTTYLMQYLFKTHKKALAEQAMKEVADIKAAMKKTNK